MGSYVSHGLNNYDYMKQTFTKSHCLCEFSSPFRCEYQVKAQSPSLRGK